MLLLRSRSVRRRDETRPMICLRVCSILLDPRFLLTVGGIARQGVRPYGKVFCGLDQSILLVGHW